MNTDIKAIENYVRCAMRKNGYPNRLTLVLARDRENRAEAQRTGGPSPESMVK